MTQRHLQIQYCTLDPEQGITLHTKSQGLWLLIFLLSPKSDITFPILYLNQWTKYFGGFSSIYYGLGF